MLFRQMLTGAVAFVAAAVIIIGTNAATLTFGKGRVIDTILIVILGLLAKH
jgi:type IV secretory pathway VirB2 component (pilin)